VADGDLVVADEQFEVRSTLFGATTAYGVESWGNLLGHSTKDADVQIGSEHGSFSGNDYLAGESKVIELKVVGSSASDLQTKLDALDAAWAPGSTVPLTFQATGMAAKRRVYGRTRSLDVQRVLGSNRYAQVGLEFFQTDPRKYSHAQVSNVYDPSETASITNAGNVASQDVVITFAPSSTGAKLTHNGSGLVIDFDGISIASTPYIVTINSAGLTVLQGATNKYGDMTSVSEPLAFRLAAGANSLTYTTDSGTGTCTVAIRSAYA
jgi:hypothetical protein